MKRTIKIHTPLGTLITHKSPGGTQTKEKTGFLGFFNIIRDIIGYGGFF